MSYKWWPFFALLLTLGFVLSSSSAFAQDARQIVLPSTGFSCAAGATSPPITAESSGGLIMSVISIFQQSLFKLMGKMYCAFSKDMEPIISGLAVIAVIVFALSFLGGLTRFSAGEAAKIIFKIGLIWLCAVNIDTAMGITYKFFLSIIQDGTSMAFGSGDSAALGAKMSNAIEGSGAPSGTSCKAGYAFIFFFALLFLPFLIMPLILFMFAFGMLFIRIISNYLVALTVLAMLMGMSPFFIAFAMFRSTKQVFDSWLNNMGSYAMQGLIVMAFIAFISHIDFLRPISQLANNMKPSLFGLDFSGLQLFGFEICTICKGFDYDAMGNVTCDGSGKGVSLFAMLTMGKLYVYITIHFIGLIILMKLLQSAVDYIPAMAQTLGGSGLAIAFAADPGGSSKGIRSGGMVSLPGFDIREIKASTGQISVIGNRANNFMTGFRWAADPYFHRREKAMVRKEADADYYRRRGLFDLPTFTEIPGTIVNTAKFGFGLATLKKDAWKDLAKGVTGRPITAATDHMGITGKSNFGAALKEGWKFAQLRGNAENDVFSYAQHSMFRTAENRAAAKKLVEAHGHFDIMQQYYRTSSQMYGFGKMDDFDLDKSYHEYTNAERDLMARNEEYYRTQGKQGVESLQSNQKSWWMEDDEKKQQFWTSMMGY